MTTNLRFQLLFVAILSCFLLGFSCDKSLEPKPVEPTDYPFYITDVASNQLFTIHPASQKLDSISFPWNASVIVSADGKLFYVLLGNSVLVVDKDSLSVITELLYTHNGASVSPDNQYLALTGKDLYILRTSDYSIVFSDTTEFLYSRGNFVSDGKAFFCVVRAAPDSSPSAFRVDLSDTSNNIIKKSFDSRSVLQVIPSLDESKWFFYLHVGLWTYSFEVYDVIADSIIFSEILVPGGGSMTLSPNGKYVFYTNPGRTATDPPSDLSFRIFDVTANAIDEVVVDTSFFCFGSGCASPKTLAVTPDGKWLGIVGGDLFQIPAFYLYDIQNRKLAFREVGEFPTVIRQFRNTVSVQQFK